MSLFIDLFIISNIKHHPLGDSRWSYQLVALLCAFISYISVFWFLYFCEEAIAVYRHRKVVWSTFSELTFSLPSRFTAKKKKNNNKKNNNKKSNSLRITSVNASSDAAIAVTATQEEASVGNQTTKLNDIFPSISRWDDPKQLLLWFKFRLYLQYWQPRLMYVLQFAGGVALFTIMILFVAFIIQVIIASKRWAFYCVLLVDAAILGQTVFRAMYEAVFIREHLDSHEGLLVGQQYQSVEKLYLFNKNKNKIN